VPDHQIFRLIISITTLDLSMLRTSYSDT